jgi:DNA-binding transcriptional ArsR family regulator
VTFFTSHSLIVGVSYSKIRILEYGGEMDAFPKLLELEAEVFDALAHPARLVILEVIRDRESCVCHIQAMSNLRQAYISQQLNILRQSGLVTSRKEGQWIFYTASDPRIYEVIDRFKEMLQTLGKWQPEQPGNQDKIEPHAVCNCPHCNSQPLDQIILSSEVECGRVP